MEVCLGRALTSDDQCEALSHAPDQQSAAVSLPFARSRQLSMHQACGKLPGLVPKASITRLHKIAGKAAISFAVQIQGPFPMEALSTD